MTPVTTERATASVSMPPPDAPSSNDLSSESPSPATMSWDELRAKLQKAVYRICPAWLVDRRDDLVQLATIKLMEAHRRRLGDDTADLGEGIPAASSSYLFRVAHSALVDEIRRLRRQRETSLDDDDNTVEPQDGHDPERHATSRRTGHAIKDCMGFMKRERRMAVTLYLQGHSVPDASKVLSWSRKRTENLVFRGLDNLRQCLRKKGIQP